MGEPSAPIPFEDRYRLLVESVTEYAIFFLDPDGKVASWNPGAQRIKGWTTPEIIGRHFSLFYTPEDVAAGKPGHNLQEAAAHGAMHDRGWRLRKDGSRFWASVTISAMRGPNGELRGFSKVTRDLTEEQAAENRFRDLLEAAPDGMIITDSRGLITRMNRGAEGLFGWSRDELVGKAIETLVPERFRRRHVGERDGYAREPRVRPMGAGLELFGLRKDGSEFPVEISLSPLETPEGRFTISAIRDITPRKRAEAERRHQQDVLDSIVENIPNMIFMKDAAELRFVRLNKAGEELIGLPRAELIGKNDYDFFPKEQADFFVAKDREVLESGVMVDIPAEPIMTKDKGLRILHTKKIPLRDARGRSQFLLGMSEDVTERVRTDERLRGLNEALSDKTRELTSANNELEAFASSVAHDLRAPIRQVLGFATLLVEDYGGKLEEEGLRRLEKIRSGARHMGELVDDLLNLARVGRQPALLENVQLGELARRTIEELQPDAEGRDVHWKVGPLFDARVDPSLMKQVFVNILSNALKYTRRRPRAIIEIGSTTTDRGERAVFVRDNGVGFDMRYAAKLFGIFQRLHADRDFEGTGVGLATVERIVRKHGGRIWADAKPDEGATFWFTVEAPAAPNKEGNP